jgi:large subunit ribosomal protein L22
MTGTKTNERPGTRAQARYLRFSAYKAREVLDLIRGQEVSRAEEILRFSERDAAHAIGKVLRSAVANAEHNDEQLADELYVSACYADEGKTIRRMRPRARGRATRIRKRTCHITIIVSRMSEDELEKRRVREASRPGSRAARRAGQEAAEERRRRRQGQKEAEAAAAAEEHDHDHDHEHEGESEAAQEGIVDQQAEAVEATGEAVPEGTELPDEAEAVAEEGIVDQQAVAAAEAEEAPAADEDTADEKGEK